MHEIAMFQGIRSPLDLRKVAKQAKRTLSGWLETHLYTTSTTTTSTTSVIVPSIAASTA